MTFYGIVWTIWQRWERARNQIIKWHYHRHRQSTALYQKCALYTEILYYAKKKMSRSNTGGVSVSLSCRLYAKKKCCFVYFRYEQNTVIESQISRGARSTRTPKLVDCLCSVIKIDLWIKYRSNAQLSLSLSLFSLACKTAMYIYLCACAYFCESTTRERLANILFFNLRLDFGYTFFNYIHATFSFHCSLRVNPFDENWIDAATVVVVVVASRLFFVFHWRIGKFIEHLEL